MVTGCNKKSSKKKISKEDAVTLTMQTVEGDLTFTYSKVNSFSLKTEEIPQDDAVLIKQTIYNNDLAIGMELGVMARSLSEYNEEVEALKGAKQYKKYELDNFDAYIYNVQDKTLSFKIKISENKKYDDAIIVSGRAQYVYNPSEDANIEKLFTDEIIRDFFDSMKLEKTEAYDVNPN